VRSEFTSTESATAKAGLFDRRAIASPESATAWRHQKPKKAGVAGHPQVSNHVGLLSNEPPGEPGCSLFSHPTTFN
jgi:hypothetical protein